ncbi:thiamine phosphate synthase [Exilibacterium tricleocarpae]|uniref:Thiamine-phosphate synthase n=2 Tax=Exilibacterium tricleocarpae TaxID=2591008 RepID=A0A545T3Q9_9GAMM|nr:thiamine phosphate synthase [Exilibacterium tricleocarpae]
MLYAITDQALMADQLYDQVEVAVAQGCTWVQYRDKSGASGQKREQAARLRDICEAHSASLIINDDVDLAKTVNAHGVHLGQEDTPLAEARDRLGDRAIIGITCHASPALALAAQEGGADYVAFGRFFPSTIKPTAPAAPLTIFSALRREINLPLVAIGGITPANAGHLVGAGADRLAVCGGLFGHGDVKTQMARFNQAIRSVQYRYTRPDTQPNIDS